MAVALEAFLPSAGSPVRLLESSPSPSPFVARLAAAAPWLEAVHTPAAEGVPRLRVTGTHAHGEIHFIGPVEGRVAEALAVLCRALATSEVEFDTPATPQLLRELETKVDLRVYVSPTCAFCPAVMAAALRFAQATPQIDVTVFRADHVPLPGQRSVPAVVANDEVIAVGSIGEYDLAERLTESLKGS